MLSKIEYSITAFLLREVSDIQGRIKPSQDRAGPLVETANEWNVIHHLPQGQLQNQIKCDMHINFL